MFLKVGNKCQTYNKFEKYICINVFLYVCCINKPGLVMRQAKSIHGVWLVTHYNDAKNWHNAKIVILDL